MVRQLTAADVDEYVALHTDREVTRFLRVQSREQALERLIENEREWPTTVSGFLP